ncbi:MAG: hypothetical protein ACK5Q5_11810, partial [Planctomycetaceae bacterium]
MLFPSHPADCSPEPPRERAVAGVGVAARLVLLIGLTAVAYAASFQGTFQFDDYGTLHHNRTIRRLWPLDDYLEGNRPFAQWTFAVNFALHELRPFGYHVGNLAIHLACGGCLFGLVYTTLLLLNRQGVDRQRA